MPIYVVRCTDENCDEVTEVRSSHEKASEMVCPKCGGATKIVPSAAAFKVNGYSFENGYHRETINYDGSGG